MGKHRLAAAWARDLFAAAVLTVVVAAALATPSRAGDSAVIIMYHRFGEPEYPSTNVTIGQFESHLEELASGEYNVLPVPEIIDALDRGRPLPDRTVGLTIDDAYLSVFTEAWPRFREAGLPFTLFVATDPIDGGYRNHMNWEQLRALARAGVTIGSQTASHPHMADSDATTNRSELERSNARFEAELGHRPDLFAYPYGEAGLEVQGLVLEAGFRAAFGQHSGAFGGGDDFSYLPRFAMNEKYGDRARFRLAASTLPLPVTEMTPADTLVGSANPPLMGFTVAPGIEGLERLSCFTSNEGLADLHRLGGTRFEIRVRNPFPEGRTRLNCTMPTGSGRWRWMGRQFYRPPARQ